MGRFGLDAQEGGEAGDGDEDRGEDRWAGEADAAAFDERGGERSEPEDRGELAGPVDPGGTAGRVCDNSQDDQCCQADREVDEEDQAPVDLGEQAAEDRSGGRGDRAADAPEATALARACTSS